MKITIHDLFPNEHVKLFRVYVDVQRVKLKQGQLMIFFNDDVDQVYEDVSKIDYFNVEDE